MVGILCFLISVALLSIASTLGADISPINIPYASGTVDSCGNQYRDSSSYKCRTCPAHQAVDPDTVGGDGQYGGCRCKMGFAAVIGDCSSVSFNVPFCEFIVDSCRVLQQDNSGECNGVTCQSCTALGLASLSDRSACVACDNSTLGLSTSRSDCVCPTGQLLVERLLNGAFAPNKSCVDCGSGKCFASFLVSVVTVRVNTLAT
jgi:hypothetical protein